MVHSKNYETASTFVKVIQRKLLASYFPVTVYNLLYCMVHIIHTVCCYSQVIPHLAWTWISQLTNIRHFHWRNRDIIK